MPQRLKHWNPLWQRKLRLADRGKLHEQPQIIGVVTRHILRAHLSCKQRHNAPFPIADRLYKVLRWTKQSGLPWLLLGLSVFTPMVRAQIADFDRQAVEIFGTVFVEAGNRPIDGVIVSIRSLPGGPFISVLTDWSGRFRVPGLDPGMYEIAVEEPGYEPSRVTLQLLRGPSPPLELHLRVSNPSPAGRTDYTVSVRELRIPGKARNAFEKGLQRLAKNDAVGSRTQFERAITAFPDYYEAQQIYRPLPADKLEERSEPLGRFAGDDPEALPQDRALIHPEDAGSFFSQVLHAGFSGEAASGLRHELAYLVNRVLVAEGVDFADRDRVAENIRVAHDTVNLALESLSGSETTAAIRLLRRHYVQHLFRVAWDILFELRKSAKRAVEAIGMGSSTGEIAFLDTPYREGLTGILGMKPRFYEGIVRPNRHIGLIGLGSGTLASYGQKG